MLGKGKLGELRAIAQAHKLAAGSQTVPNSVVEIAIVQGQTPPQGATSSRVLLAPQRKKLVLRKPKRKAPQVVQEDEEDDEATDGLITKRNRVAPSSPHALPTPTPPSPPAPTPPSAPTQAVPATPWPLHPQGLKAAIQISLRTPQVPPHHSCLLERVILLPLRSLGPH